MTTYRYDDFEHSADLVRIGEEATRAALPEIRKCMEQGEEKVPALGPSLAPAVSTTVSVPLRRCLP